MALRDDSASVAEYRPSTPHMSQQGPVHRVYVGQPEVERLLTPVDPGAAQSAPIMAGSLMAMAYLVVAGRSMPQDSRNGLLLEMASPHRRHGHTALPSAATSTVMPSSRQPTVPVTAVQSKEAELAAALQVAADLEAQVTALAEDVKEREQQLNGMQETAKAQATASKGALKESQRKVALLEAMVKALRERLSSEEERTTALSAEVVAGQEALAAADSARQEAESRVVELKQEVKIALGLLAQAEARASALESRVAELIATSAQLQSRVTELEAEATAAAVVAHDAEARILAIQSSAARDAAAAEAAMAELAARQTELEEARRALERSQQEAEEQSAVQTREMSAAMEEAVGLVRAREQQVEQLQAQLDKAKAQAESESASKATELASVRQGLEAALAAAREEVTASNQELEQMRSEVELVLHADLAALVAGTPQPQAQGQTVTAAAWQATQAATELRHLSSRQLQLNQEIQARTRALEEQAEEVYPLLQGPLAVQASALRSRHTQLLTALRETEARWERDGSGMQAVSRLRRDVSAVVTELAGVLRTAMTGPQRTRERTLRSELADRETELRGVTARILKLRQQQQPAVSAKAGAAAAGEAAKVLQAVNASGQLPAALAQRLRELLKQRDAEAAAAARAREAELERTSKEREQAAVRAAQEREAAQLAQIRAKERAMAVEQQQLAKDQQAKLAAVEAQYQKQLDATKADLADKVRVAEAAWRQQMQEAQRAAQQAASETQRLAAEVAMGSVQARQQLSELASVREELAARSRQLTDVKATYESSKAAVERRAAGAAAEAALVAGQVEVLQKALQAREVEVNRLKTLEQSLASGAQAAPPKPTKTPPPPTDTSDKNRDSGNSATSNGNGVQAPPSPTQPSTPFLAGGRELFMASPQQQEDKPQPPPPTTHAPASPAVPTPDKGLSSVAAFLEATKPPAAKEADQKPPATETTEPPPAPETIKSLPAAGAMKPAAAPEATGSGSHQKTEQPPVATDAIKAPEAINTLTAADVSLTVTLSEPSQPPAASPTIRTPVSPWDRTEGRPQAASPTRKPTAEKETSGKQVDTQSPGTLAQPPAVVPSEALKSATSASPLDSIDSTPSSTAPNSTAPDAAAVPQAAALSSTLDTSPAAALDVPETARVTASSKTSPPAELSAKSSDIPAASTANSVTTAPSTQSDAGTRASMAQKSDSMAPVDAPKDTRSASSVNAGSATQTPPAATQPPASSRRPMPPLLPSNQWGQPKAPQPATPDAPQTSAQPSANSNVSAPANPTTTLSTSTSSSAPPAKPASAFPEIDDLGAEISRITQSLVTRQQSNTPAATRAATPQARGSPAQATPGGTRRRTLPMHLLTAGYMMPHTAKVESGGEDAYFISSVGAGALGVTDGVGGWAADGVDVAAYARGICETAAKAVEDSAGTISAGGALEHAQMLVNLPGSCTACVAILRPAKGVLEVANVGDSGMRLLRGGRVVGATAVQEHAFNMPYQLASPEGFPETDMATDAQLYSFPVQEGDVIVMASDGLWDNLWDEQIVSIVSQTLPPAGNPPTSNTASLIASRLTKSAHIAARDSNARTPWAVESAAASGSILQRFFPRGGKMDDVTVVAAIVQL